MKKFCFFLLFATGCYQNLEHGETPLVSIQIQDRNGLTETISVPERLKVYQDVDFLSSQPYKKVLRFFKRDNKMAAKITTYHPNGIIWQYLESQDMRAFGAYKEWYPNGTLKIEATVIGGTADVVPGAQQDWLFDGMAKVWDEQGRPQASIPYEKGVLQGHSITYFPDGQMQKESPYLNNLLEGESIEYYPNGKVLSKTFYRKGLKHGPSIGFWPNGEACWAEEYQDGLLLDGWYQTKEGILVCEVKSGFGYQALFKDAHLERVVEYRRGKPEGVIKMFRPDGELKTQYQIRNGRKQGEEIEYFSSREQTEAKSTEPLPKISIPWDGDMISGIVKTWYNNGKLQSQREMARNKKSGTSIAWYRDGGLMFMEEYEDDHLVNGQYFKKNQKDSVSSITNGNGIATLYDENGVFLRKVQYVKGKPIDPEN